MSGFKLEVNLTGYKALLDLLSPGELEELLQEIEMEINDTLELIFTESQNQVPVEFSPLKLSGKIHLVKRDSEGMEGQITYGTEYALWQHEIPMNHDGDGEKDHYLSDPVQGQSDFLIAEIKRIIENYFGEVKET